MVSRIEGERFLIVGTLDAVETGQEFERIPQHMSIGVWFQFYERQQKFLTGAMRRVFEGQDLYQKLEGGRHRRLGENKRFPAREMLGAEQGPWYGMHALVKGLGKYRADDEYADTFLPHITDQPDRKIKKGEQLAIPTVALIRAHSDEALQSVVAAYELGGTNG